MLHRRVVSHARPSPRLAPPARRRGGAARAALLALVAPVTLACSERTGRAAALPPLSFLVSAGDSTFWVEHAAARLTVRRSPMLLTEVGGRFFELYLTDDDRSYYDAVIVGQRIFRRDVTSGDSLELYHDRTLARLAADYAAAHPNEAPLGPDD
ncbi:MAG TPA: hypothetical protein VFV33_22085, partial [Gemmatimonadaceae bacterium]|nr:hypothetical protein [Gemmatimonadaceae bacterium]